MTTEAREQAIKQLRDYRRDRAEADNVSLSLDARMWESLEERVSEAAMDTGLTEKEVEDILYGDG
jgi:hypothetical protein